MKIFQSRFNTLRAPNYNELERAARKLHNQIVAKTKRNPYIRSKYFANQKIFVNLFWNHLNDKIRVERKRRLQFYNCAIDLLRNTLCDPVIVKNPNRSTEIFYRFYGESRDEKLFCVQVKQEIRRDNKFFMSVFPVNKTK